MNRKEFVKQGLIGSAILGTFTGAGLINGGNSVLEQAGLEFTPLFNGQDLSGFVDVNTSEDTWWVEDGILKATGHPIGVLRTEKQYENFILTSNGAIWSLVEIPAFLFGQMGRLIRIIGIHKELRSKCLIHSGQKSTIGLKSM